MGRLPITFLSDYGTGDDFAGVCRAVIAKLAPEVRVIDLSHGIPRHDVRTAGIVLADALPYAPRGVHLAIVDPGVGGERRAIALRTGEGHFFVAPDNGLVMPATDALGGISSAVDVSSSKVALDGPSDTFHGRDIFAPVAATIAEAGELSDVGEPVDPDTLERTPPTEPRIDQHAAVAHAHRIDGFGNVTLDLRFDDLQGHPLAGAGRISIGSSHKRRTAQRGRAFDSAPEGAFLFYQDSSGRMAIAINHGDAA
ncbi:MAG: SAM hydrolase/SAM-dependent halogenase family protein, partial [Solirubrobacterales bacterium]